MCLHAAKLLVKHGADPLSPWSLAPHGCLSKKIVHAMSKTSGLRTNDSSRGFAFDWTAMHMAVLTLQLDVAQWLHSLGAIAHMPRPLGRLQPPAMLLFQLVHPLDFGMPATIPMLQWLFSLASEAEEIMVFVEGLDMVLMAGKLQAAKVLLEELQLPAAAFMGEGLLSMGQRPPGTAAPGLFSPALDYAAAQAGVQPPLADVLAMLREHHERQRATGRAALSWSKLLDKRTITGATPLADAAVAGHLENMRALLASGADAGTPCIMRPLESESGAVHLGCSHPLTPLMHSIVQGQMQAACCLLDAGACCRPTAEWPMPGRLGMVHGAVCLATDASTRTWKLVLCRLAVAGLILTVGESDDGMTPLHLAIRARNAAAADALIDLIVEVEPDQV